MKNKDVKASGIALIPFLVFIAIYLGAGAIMQAKGVEFAFYQFPSVVAVFIATIVAFFILKGTIDEKFEIFAKGAGHLDIMCMLMIFLLAGGFSAVASAMGGVDSTVNLGLSVIPAQYITAGVFVISSFLSFATGTSMGTVGAVVPVALGLV
ncbi:MAG: Na+/H+ antiporter NhaC family protein, partial [Firmicutes bacterium]|nr:Na+/H+ antiporter NhaC family protein [Bacillota bacterium]